MAYKHFDTHVLSVDWVKLIGDFEREYNGEGWQLIEPCVFPLLAPACHLPCSTARDLPPAQRGRLPPATARPPSPGSRRVEGLADQHHMASRGQPMEQCHRGAVRKPRRVLIRSCRQGGQVRTSLVTGQRSANPLLCSAPLPLARRGHLACGHMSLIFPLCRALPAATWPSGLARRLLSRACRQSLASFVR